MTLSVKDSPLFFPEENYSVEPLFKVGNIYRYRCVGENGKWDPAASFSFNSYSAEKPILTWYGTQIPSDFTAFNCRKIVLLTGWHRLYLKPMPMSSGENFVVIDKLSPSNRDVDLFAYDERIKLQKADKFDEAECLLGLYKSYKDWQKESIALLVLGEEGLSWIFPGSTTTSSSSYISRRTWFAKQSNSFVENVSTGEVFSNHI